MSPAHANGLTNGTSNDVATGVADAVFPLEKLSWTITKNAGIVSQHLAANHLPQPSSGTDGPSVVVPSDAPQYIQQARQNLISASLEILQLAIGPSEYLPNLATGFQYVSCLEWLCHYDIFHLVPLGASISYTSLAAAAAVSLPRLKAIVRMAMTGGLFCETSDGNRDAVAHSATSAHLARSPDVYAYATWMCRNTAPTAGRMTAAAAKWSTGTTNPGETAFGLAFNTDLPFFDYLAAHEDKMHGFAAYMRSVRSSGGVDLRHLAAGFAWVERVRDGGVVVDVGGSTGGAAAALATAFPHLRFVVQDLPTNAEKGRELMAADDSPVAKDAASRITFQSHNFLDAQPVTGADVYLLRMILHDWPDEVAAKIVRNLVAAMDRGKPPGSSRLLIMDTVLPKPGSVPVSEERILRVRDMTMLQAFNSKERDMDDWKQLLALADPNLELVRVVQPFGSTMSVLEVVVGSANITGSEKDETSV